MLRTERSYSSFVQLYYVDRRLYYQLIAQFYILIYSFRHISALNLAILREVYSLPLNRTNT